LKFRALRRVSVALTILLACALVACGGGGSSSNAVLQSVNVSSAPGNMEIGGTRQFTATGSYSDGSSKALAAGVTWTSSDSAIAEVSSTGMVTAKAAGTATISASLQGHSGTGSVAVIDGSGGGPDNPLTIMNFGMTEHNVEANGFPTDVSVGIMRINNDQSSTFGHGTTNVKWSDINTANDVYNWGLLDWLVAEYNSQGYEILYTFGYAPQWTHPVSCATPSTQCPCVGTDGPCWPPDDVMTTNTAWKNFVTQITQRYRGAENGGTHGRIKYWGIWNEPNSQTGGVGNFWREGGTTATAKTQLGKMAADAYPIIKNVPGNLVLTPDPQGTAIDDFMTNYIDAIKDAGAPCNGIGNNICADIISIHTYVGSNFDTVETTLKNSMIDPLNSALASRGLGGLEIWDTESSWGNGDDYPNWAKRIAWVGRHTITEMALGLKMIIWWSWTEEALDSKLKTKPGGTPPSTLCTTGIAWREVTEWLIGSEFTGALTNVGNEWSVTVKRADGSTAFIIWDLTNLASASGGSCTSQGTLTTANKTVPDQYTHYMKLDGTTVAITGSPGSRQVPVSIKPIMLITQ
jgi:hypothetical protein